MSVTAVGQETHARRDLDLLLVPFHKLEISHGATELEVYLFVILKICLKCRYQLGHAVFEREHGALVELGLEGIMKPGLFPHCLVQVQVIGVKQLVPFGRVGLSLNAEHATVYAP